MCLAEKASYTGRVVKELRQDLRPLGNEESEKEAGGERGKEEGGCNLLKNVFKMVIFRLFRFRSAVALGNVLIILKSSTYDHDTC